MLKTRTLGILALTAVVCVGLYVPLQRTISMSDTQSKDAPATSAKPQPRVQLEFIGIDKSVASMPKVQVLAYVENPSDDTMKVLRWNSVLDNQAGLLGAITLRNQHTAKTIDVPTIMINRKTPPPDEEYIRIEPHAKVSNQISLALTTTDLEEGADYEAVAEGRFMEIWRGDQQGDPADCPYSSDAVRFKA
jgi:hypothetical protein